MLTFDIEEWFQVENLRPLFPTHRWDHLPRRLKPQTRLILRLLAEHRLRATFFVLGWVAERDPALVREIADAGHEVASHGYGHVLPLTLSLSEFRADVTRARAALEEAAGQPVIGYRAPSFNIDQARLDVLDDLGFRYDSSHHPFAIHDRYGRFDLDRPVAPGVYRVATQMTEVGLPVEHLGPLSMPVSGGGYFRLYPGAMFRHAARRALRRRRHYTMYLHSWEFDPDQPRVRGAGLVRSFRHYNNLDRTLPRLHGLVQMLRSLDTEFLTVREFVERRTPA
jgi:polysaccharide deacetylase family protein (PEP-CTERM system associated)